MALEMVNTNIDINQKSCSYKRQEQECNWKIESMSNKNHFLKAVSFKNAVVISISLYNQYTNISVFDTVDLVI